MFFVFFQILIFPSPLIIFNSSFTIQIQFIQIIWIYFWFLLIFLTILLYINLETKNKHQYNCLNMSWDSLSYFLGAVFPVDHLRLWHLLPEESGPDLTHILRDTTGKWVGSRWNLLSPKLVPGERLGNESKFKISLATNSHFLNT